MSGGYECSTCKDVGLVETGGPDEVPHVVPCPDCTPRFEHDCNQCIYLGGDSEYDYWFCKTGVLGDTLIARYSDVGSDYLSASSGIVKGIRTHGWTNTDGTVVPGTAPEVQDYSLVKALGLAEKKKLVSLEGT